MKFKAVELSIGGNISTIGEETDINDLVPSAIATAVQENLKANAGQPLEFARLLIDDRLIGLSDVEPMINELVITNIVTNLVITMVTIEEQ